MTKQTRLIIILICLAVLVPAGAILAQDATVPDLTGLSVPVAAATLNRSGLVLGTEDNQGWTAESGLPQNSVSAQSIPAGQSVPRGTAVDVTVLHSPNALLIYDDNDLSLVNQTGGPLNLNTILLNSVGGSAAFSAARWGGTLDNNHCGQVWSIGVTAPKKHPECSSTQWLTTNKPAEHFWTGEDGTTQFSISQNGIVRAVCPVANPGRCEFYLASSASGGDVTDYVYFAYTTDRLIVRNASTDKWMPLAQSVITNNINGFPLTLGDPALFTGQEIIGTVTRLAPGQCLFFTKGLGQDAAPPQTCDVVARLDIDPTLIFWGQGFELKSVSDGQQHACPAATEGRLTLCVMPR